MSVRIRIVQAIELGQGDRLDDGESALGAVAQIADGLLRFRRWNNSRPCRRAEKGLPVDSDEEPPFSETFSCGSCQTIGRGRPRPESLRPLRRA